MRRHVVDVRRRHVVALILFLGLGGSVVWIAQAQIERSSAPTAIVLTLSHGLSDDDVEHVLDGLHRPSKPPKRFGFALLPGVQMLNVFSSDGGDVSVRLMFFPDATEGEIEFVERVGRATPGVEHVARSSN